MSNTINQENSGKLDKMSYNINILCFLLRNLRFFTSINNKKIEGVVEKYGKKYKERLANECSKKICSGTRRRI